MITTCIRQDYARMMDRWIVETRLVVKQSKFHSLTFWAILPNCNLPKTNAYTTTHKDVVRQPTNTQDFPHYYQHSIINKSSTHSLQTLTVFTHSFIHSFIFSFFHSFLTFQFHIISLCSCNLFTDFPLNQQVNQNGRKNPPLSRCCLVWHATRTMCNPPSYGWFYLRYRGNWAWHTRYFIYKIPRPPHCTNN